MGRLHQTPPLRAQGRGVGRIVRARGMEDTVVTVSSRCYGTTAHTNSQTLWQHAQGLHRSMSDGAQAVSWGSGYYLLSPTKTLSPVDIPLQRKNQRSTIESHWVYKAHFRVDPWPAVDAPQSKLNGNFGTLLSHTFGLYLSLETFGLYVMGSDCVFMGSVLCPHLLVLLIQKLWLLLEVFGDFTMICICQFAICVFS